MNKFIVFLIKFARTVCRPFYPVKVYGERNVPVKKCLIVGNHLSGWDPLLYTMWTKNVVSFVYKSEFQRSLFLKWVFEGIDCVPVRRGEVDLNASKRILRLLKNDKSVVLFPEGTRNPNVDCLQPFHTGAALFALKTKSPLRPFYIWDKTKFCRKNYMIIGDEFTLEQFYDKPINRQVLDEATEVIKSKVDELRVRLNALLDAKGVKRRPRTKKETEKIKAYNEKQRNLASELEKSNAKQTDPPKEGSD